MIRPAARCNAVSSGATDAPDLVADQPSSALPAGLIADDEIVILMLRPSLLFVGLSSMAGLSITAVVTLTLALLSIRIAWIPWSEAAVYALGVGGAAIQLLWQSLEWFGLIYVLTDRRVIRRAGVVRVSVFETPLRTIQHTSVFQPLRERVLGLGSIGFATAGSDVFDAFWVTVRRPFAVHKLVVEAIDRYGGRRG